MTNLKLLRTTGALAGAVALLAAPVAEAATETFNYTVATTPTDWDALGNSLTLFNLNLGTLNSITITASITGSASGTLHNGQASTADMQINLTDGLVLGSQTNQALDTALGSFVTNFVTLDFASNPSDTVTQAFSRSFTLPANTTSTTFSYEISQSGSKSIDSSNFGLFEDHAGGSIDLSFGTDTGYIISGGGNSGSASIATSMGAQVSVTYDYTPTSSPPASPPASPPTNAPEPASMAILAAGLAGLGGIVRRKRRV
jgi:hypothetical protein